MWAIVMRHVLLVSVVLFRQVSAFAQAPPASQTSSAHQAYDRANSLFVAQKFPESWTAIEEALRLDPKLVPALTLRAKPAMAMNRYDVAKESLERALAADPSAWYAQFLYGFQFYQQNEMPTAIAALEKARLLNPRDPRTALYLGLAQESLGRVQEALALYKEAISLESTAGQLHAETILTGARLELLLNDFQEGERLIRQASKAEPRSRDPHFELARLLLKKGDPMRAAMQGEIALTLHEGDITDRQIRYLLVQAYGASGQHQEAEVHAAALRAMDAAPAK